MPCGRPRREFRSPMTSPTASSGTLSVTSMIGSSSTAPACCQRLLHRDRAGHLERHLAGVDRVVAAVVQAHAHALDREAGDRAVGHRVLAALAHRGDEALGDDAALDLVDEVERVGRIALVERLDADVAVAELAAPAGLLLVAPVGGGRLADRLLVGDARRLEVDLARRSGRAGGRRSPRRAPARGRRRSARRSRRRGAGRSSGPPPAGGAAR